MVGRPLRVRRLTVRAPSDTLARRAAIPLEDALRTASLSGSDSPRVLVIRMLRLGRIRADASSSQLALAIEHRLWQLGSSAVHALDPAAPAAAAVYFTDTAEAHALLASRVARGDTLAEWFWCAAVPAWKPGSSRDEALRDVLNAIALLTAAPLVAAELVRAVASGGAGDALCGAIRDSDATAWIASYPWTFVPDTAGAPPAPRAISVPFERLLDRWVPAWGMEDPRSVWLAAVSLIAAHASSAGDARLRARAEALVRARVHAKRGYERTVPALLQSELRKEDDAAVAHTRSNRKNGESVVEQPAGHRAPRQAPPATSTRPPRASDHTPADDRVESRPNERPPTAAASAWEVTRGAGLLFLLQPLARLGMAEMLATQPHLAQYDIPIRLLVSIADRVAVPADDPVRRLLVAFPHAGEQAAEFVAPLRWREGICREVAPLRWREGIYREGSTAVQRVAGDERLRVASDASGRLCLAVWRGRAPRTLVAFGPLRRERDEHAAGSPLDWLVDAWMVAVRRWCRRYAHIGLRDVVCRDGRVLLTSTHAGVRFNLQCSELRVRRAGLDLDPGWVPWFGRVVRFHYGSGGFDD